LPTETLSVDIFDLLLLFVLYFPFVIFHLSFSELAP